MLSHACSDQHTCCQALHLALSRALPRAGKLVNVREVYWLGIRRPGLGASYNTVTGGQVSQTISNANPYAHWVSAG